MSIENPESGQHRLLVGAGQEQAVYVKSLPDNLR
jgi:hypothetical protein